MTVSGVTTNLASGIAAGTPKVLLSGGDDFASQLQLGQVIKGRVLRHVEGDRYAVDFNGREKVVDTAIPFKTGDVLYGRVVGLGERVELQRVPSPENGKASADNSAALPGITGWRSGSRQMSMVIELFAQHQMPLPADEAAVIDKSIERAADPRLMAQAALFLAKLGMTITPEWLKAVYATLTTNAGDRLFATSGTALQLEIAPPSADAANAVVDTTPLTDIAVLLQQLVEALPEDSRQDNALPDDFDTTAELPADEFGTGAAGGDTLGSQYSDSRDPSRWLMNAQTGGSVGHRVNTIALLVNARLIELDIAVFDQNERKPVQQATRHRQVAFSLQTEQLGQVEARLIVTGEHVKLVLATNREEAADALSNSAPTLLLHLQDDGWTVDALQVEVANPTSSEVARAVMQHVIRQDSMSRLI